MTEEILLLMDEHRKHKNDRDDKMYRNSYIFNWMIVRLKKNFPLDYLRGIECNG